MPASRTSPVGAVPWPPPMPTGLLARVREKSLASALVFQEAVWKDSKGLPVKAAKLHETEFDFLDRARERGIPAVLLAPYGSGKTEGGGGYILRLLTKDPTLRIGVVCDNDEHARDRVGMLLRYIEDREGVGRDYGLLFPEIQVAHGQRGRRTLNKFRLRQTKGKDAAVEGTGVFASPTGGRKDILWIDDIVTKQNAIAEPAQRDRIKGAFFGGWLSRLELEVGSWWFYIGTTYHADDLTTALRESKAFAVMVIGVSEDFTHYDVEERWPGKESVTYTLPLWEPKMSTENLKRRYASMAESGDTIEWLTGYRNMIVDPSRATFKEGWFRRGYHKIHNPKGFHVSERPGDYTFRVLFADPATTVKKRSDYYAGWVLGWDPSLRAAVALYGWYLKQGLTDRVQTYLRAFEKWQPHVAGIEGRHEISFGERIEEVALDEHLGLKLRKLDREVDKDARIGNIAPILDRGQLLVDGERFPYVVTEAQLWPNAKHDDALDALEGAWHLMRTWLRRGHRVPKTFDLEGQYERTPQSGVKQFPPPMRKSPSEDIFGM